MYGAFIHQKHNQQKTTIVIFHSSNFEELWKNISWKQIDINIKTLFPQSYELKQGIIGNCYLISVLMTLTNIQIQKLFQKIEPNKAVIQFFKQGKPFPVTIDTFFPYYNDQPAFIQGSEWAQLVEKAYAKFYGAYINLEGGSPSLTYNDLLGTGYETYLISEFEDRIIPFFETNLDQQCLLCAYTKVESDKFQDHAFAVINLTNGCINMKNPSEQAIQTFKEEDIKQLFEGVCVAKYNNNLQLIDCQAIDSKTIIKIEIKKNSTIQFGIHQVDNKIMSESFAFVRLALSKQNLSNYNYIDGKFKQSRDVFIYAPNLDIGIYAIAVEIVRQKGDNNPITFKGFSSDLASNAIIKNQIQDDVYLKVIKDTIASNIKVENYKSYDQQNIPIKKSYGNDLGYLYFYYKNDSLKHMIYELIIFNQLIGYQQITKPSEVFRNIEEQEKILSEHMNSSREKGNILGKGFEIMVHPQTTEMILFTQLPFDTKECHFSFKSKTDIFESDQPIIIIQPNLSDHLNQFQNQFDFNLSQDQKKLLTITLILAISCFILFILDSKCAMIDVCISLITSQFVLNAKQPRLNLTLAKLYVIIILFAFPSAFYKVLLFPRIYTPLALFVSLTMIKQPNSNPFFWQPTQLLKWCYQSLFLRSINFRKNKTL